MPEHRRKFSPQFKAEAVQMVIETGKSIAQVARGLRVHDGTLGNWVNAWRHERKVVWICRLLRVPRSSFHAWRNKKDRHRGAAAGTGPPGAPGL